MKEVMGLVLVGLVFWGLTYFGLKKCALLELGVCRQAHAIWIQGEARP